MKILSLDQRSPAWHAWRDGGLGGSDIGPIMLGDDWPFKDSRAEALFNRKIGRSEPQEDSFVMRRGRWMEDDVRLWFVGKYLGNMLSCYPVCVQHDDIDWMRASLDGIVVSIVDNKPLAVVEIKVPNWHAHDIALAGAVPSYYVPQVQYQLMVTGLDALDYVSYSINQRYGERDKYAVVRVTPDAEMQAEILEKCQAFWHRIISTRSDYANGNPAAIAALPVGGTATA